MALINCSDCGYEFSDKAAACPKCGCPNTPGGMTPISQPDGPAKPVSTHKPAFDLTSEQWGNLLGGACVIALTGWGVWYWGMGGLETQTESSLDRIYQQVVDDEEAKYAGMLGRRSTTQTDLCVQAGMVAAAHLQAQNMSDWNHWNERRNQICGKAGIPY